MVENAVFGGDEAVQYHLATDASKTAIGCVLFQLIDREPGVPARAANRSLAQIIIFISLRMSDAESRFATTEQEALAVLCCLQEVRWLMHRSAYPVLVYTDHSALIHLLNHDDMQGRVARWQLKHSEYDLQYDHIPGTQNVIADGLSSMPERYFTTIRKQIGIGRENLRRGTGKEIGKPEKDRAGGEEIGREVKPGEDEEDKERDLEAAIVRANNECIYYHYK